MSDFIKRVSFFFKHKAAPPSALGPDVAEEVRTSHPDPTAAEKLVTPGETISVMQESDEDKRASSGP